MHTSLCIDGDILTCTYRSGYIDINRSRYIDMCGSRYIDNDGYIDINRLGCFFMYRSGGCLGFILCFKWPESEANNSTAI
jgi:hypothetical protein